MGKGVWGIDVSKFSVKAVRLEGTKDSATLTQYAIIPYPPNETGEAPNLDEQIRNALRDLKEGQKIGGEPVVFSLPSHSTFNRLIKLPPVEEEKIPEIVRYEAQSQIPFNIDEVIWDYQFIERAYGPGEEKEVILFAIKRDIVEQFLGNIAELGFNVDAVQFGPVALFNFLLRDQDVGNACVALDMGGDNTDLIVIDGTKFWVRNLPITGNDITKALQKAFNIPFAEAEKLKLKAGQSQQAQKIFNAIQPILRDLVNEVNRSIGYYKSISKTSKFDKILLLGNSTRTLNFQKFVSQSLQLPAVGVDKLNKIGVGGRVDSSSLGDDLNSIGTALGLALQGQGGVVNRVTLLPPAYVRKKELKKKQPVVMIAMAVLYLLVGIIYLQLSGQVKTLGDLHGKGMAAKKTKDGLVKAFNEAIVIQDVAKSLGAVTAIATERDLALRIMDEITPNIPNNGDFAMPIDQKLWVVEWKLDEEPRSGTQTRELIARKNLRATIEVVISKRGSVDEGRNFVIQTLLNYNNGGRTPLDPKKACAIKNANWELTEGQGAGGSWGVELDDNTLDRPYPKSFTLKSAVEETQQGSYWRYRVTLVVPVGAADRREAAAAPAGEKKP